MISVEEAQDIIFSSINSFGSTSVNIENAMGRILADDVFSEREIPPWANSAMDGYAVRAEDLKDARKDNPVVLKVIERIQAGVKAKSVLNEGEAIRIMTGAPIPDGADAIVLQEETEENDSGDVKIFISVESGESVRVAGEDVEIGDLVVSRGIKLRPPAIGMLANIGTAKCNVSKKPKVAILATGEELVDLNEVPKEGQIFNSNSYALAAQVEEAGGEPILLGIAKDNSDDLIKGIKRGMSADILITSGGVSVGDYDLVKDALKELGNEINFWRIRMKPGKPMAFGMLGGNPFFGLPGNPVSTMVTFELFVRPVLLKMQGAKDIFRTKVNAILKGELLKSPERRHYVRAVTAFIGDVWEAKPLEVQGSNILHTMVKSNSLVVFPEYETKLEDGKTVEVILLDGTMS
ncbi:MAG: gephyrin-like molybdotransferase Glp [Nitrospinota bacterium]|nr:gephyrin-like molybdotransferase Glp [Nitrospinota bacterium]